MLNPSPLYAGKFIDRSPGIPTAGKLIPTSESVEICMKEPISRPHTPPVIRKFLNTRRPDAGAIRVFYGKANDSTEAHNIIHGISSRSSLSAKLLVNPSPRTLFQQRWLEQREARYLSHQKTPLGRSYDQRPGLPDGLDVSKMTFGIKTQRDYGGNIINPPKNREQVDKEHEAGHHLYTRSHSAYYVGEQMNRNYDWTKYTKDSKFGKATPHYNDGRHVAKSLQWLNDLQMKKAAKIVLKRNEDFRERTQHELGKGLDPIADTMNVSPDHTFGILLRPDEYGVGDLLHYTPALQFLRGKDRQRAVLAAIRQHLKKVNFHNFSTLLDAFRHYDKKGNGTINQEDLKVVCRQFNLDLNPELLNALIECCDVDKDGQINFLEFANFLNWKDKMPLSILEENILTRGKKRMVEEGVTNEGLVTPDDLQCEGYVVGKALKTLTRPNSVPHNFCTSSSMINAVVGGPSAAGYRTCGIPSVRTDLAAPCIKRVSDRTNYGDESDVRGLVNPSLYTLKGVTEKHLFMSRSKSEIATIFHNTGMDIPEDTFQQVWNLASKQHRKGLVCIETFNNALNEIQKCKIRYMQ
ncbi:EF-hand domain-containing family member B [Polypterus senegalus]|uniref:EF-hand domain-containing family member B n=1 Tax=Polypterus senegalus TaxID=55291 RepID=UPI0019654610|nr:EF-hand domain-containing family member B [Polypterus senegalus]